MLTRPLRFRPTMYVPALCLVLVIGLLARGYARRTASRVPASATAGVTAVSTSQAVPVVFTDPVCQMEVGRERLADYDGQTFAFCAERCRTRFLENPAAYVKPMCLVCRSEGRTTPVAEGVGCRATWEGTTYGFCSDAHRERFQADPAGFFLHTMWGIPNWLYYASIALVLVLSFLILEWKGRAPGGRRGGQAAVPDPEPADRFDLLQIRWFKRLVCHPATRFVLQAFVLGAFVMILVAGLFGDQLPGRNVAPLLTWTIWWGGLVWLILYAGKAWCYVCPWNAVADWAEGMRLWGKRRHGLTLGLKWPRALRNIWPATILFVALTWVELGFNVTLSPRFTAWLGLAMLGLAFGCAFLFDRKAFCRYGCLVGRVSGLYALFAPVEIRPRRREVCRTCTARTCYKGNEQGDPCPTFELLGTMRQNTYCIACLECVKTCVHDNVALNIRPWGADLAHRHRPRADEAYLALAMLALTGFHGLTMTTAWQQVADGIGRAVPGGPLLAFTSGMIAVMTVPILLYAALVALSHRLAGTSRITYREYFMRYAYAVLPIALFYHLAHNSEHLLMEGQRLVALLSDPLGHNWNLFATAGLTLPPLADLPTLWGVQVLFVLIGHLYSLWVARRVAVDLFPDRRAALRSQLPMLAAMIAFSVMSLWLLKQPMQMRSSIM